MTITANFLEIKSNLKVSTYTVTETMHQEKKHLIVPVIMIVEGVLNGSHGALLHLAEDFGKIPASWNGIPVVINHPEQDGVPISANSPEVIDTQTVGRVYNAQLISNKLSAEVWLDEEKLGVVSVDILNAVKAKKPIEVSVGVFTEDEETPGVYVDQQYNAIARNHKPDHLALLPGAVGACSLADGCGIRANQEGGKMDLVERNLLNLNIMSLKDNGIKVPEIVDNSEAGLNEKLDKLRDLVRSLNPAYVEGQASSERNYLIEAYDTYLIYEKEGPGFCKYYKQNYQFAVADGNAELVGEPIEVRRKVEYESINSINNNSKKPAMAEEKCTPCVAKKAGELIANKQTKFTEADRDWLQTLEESVLDRMVPEPAEVQVVEKPVANALAPEDQAALDYGKKMLAQRKAEMTAVIQKNTKAGTWPDAVLNTMNEDMLERVFESVKKETAESNVVDYSLNGNSRSFQANSAEAEEKLLPPGLN